MKQISKKKNTGETPKVDHVRRPYELYVVILRDNSNYFVGNVERHEKGTILIQNGYQTFIPTEQIFAEVAITAMDFKEFKRLDTASLLVSLKRIAREDVGMLKVLGKKKVVKRPTEHRADAQTHRAQTSSLGYLGSLLNPISVKDWLFGQTNTSNRAKLIFDEIVDDKTQTAMQTGTFVGAALGKYIERKKRAAAPGGPPDDGTDYDYEDEDEEHESESEETKEDDTNPNPNPHPYVKRIEKTPGYIPQGGYSHEGVGRGGQKGGGHKQPNEKRNNKQAPDRDARTRARSVKKDLKSTIERIKEGRQARAATARKKKDRLFTGTFKQFVSL